ncbi:MAG: hypothetical protein AB8B73_01740 [Ekhidna sp.]
MDNIKKIILGVSLLLSFSSFSQESIIKKFTEQDGKRWLYPICLYPSTLRMVNLSGDPKFNELINDVEKILIYPLDSSLMSSPDLNSWIKEYESIGYEEFIRVSGPQSIHLVGKKDEYVGMFGADGSKVAFYVRGSIAFEKIPELIKTFKGNDLLNILTDQLK